MLTELQLIILYLNIKIFISDNMSSMIDSVANEDFTIISKSIVHIRAAYCSKINKVVLRCEK